MTFFKFEIDHLSKLFPRQEATLKLDFDDDELEAIDQLDLFKIHSPHLYLGKNSKLN